MSPKIITLLGRRDYPTDGVADYCQCLIKELNNQNYPSELLEFPWQKEGILSSLKWLWQESKQWQNQWVLLQYTNFSWFSKGFPFGFLIVILLLKIRGCKLGFICHERYDFPAQRPIDKLRRWFQFKTLQIAYYWCAITILTLPKEVTPWLPSNADKAIMITVGSAIQLEDNKSDKNPFVFDGKTVVIFGLTGGNVEGEVEAISYALKQAVKQVPKLRLLAVGRDTDLGKELLKTQLADTSVTISIFGLLSSSEIAQAFAASDVFLFVRGCLSTGRSSAVASIASKLPMVAYSGEETAYPLTETGVVLVPQGNQEKLAQNLTKILTDDDLREKLRHQSIKAYQEHFSWEAIASKVIKTLNKIE